MPYSSLLITSLASLLMFNTDSSAQLTWGLQATPTSSSFRDIHFTSTIEGWAVGTGGEIVYTNDAGSIWQSQISGITDDLKSVYFLNPNEGWSVGSNSVIVKTLDGGQTWSSSLIGSNNTLESVFFVDNMNGYVVGFDATSNFGVLYQTNNGGVSWTQITALPGTGSLYDVKFLDANTGWITGNGVIYNTINGGATWTDQSALAVGFIESIAIISQMEAWVVGLDGLILKTIDGGINWNPQTSGVTEYLWDVAFLDNLTGMAIGLNGLILTTADGGINWITEPSFTSTSLYGVFVSDLEAIWVCGLAGEIYRSPETYNDLIISAVQIQDTLCIGVPSIVGLVLVNIGGTSINSATITATDGVNVLGTEFLTGTLAPGDSTDIQFTQITIYSDTTLFILIDGDSLTANNIFSNEFFAVPGQPYTLTADEEICFGNSIDLIVTGGNTYNWDNTTDNPSFSVQTVTPSATQLYLVSIYQDYCTILDSVLITVNDCDKEVNAFSPNGDGVNEFFFIEGIENTQNTVTIYNRWGDVEIEFQDYDNINIFWVGDNDYGEPLNSGTYYYTVEIFNDNSKKSGWVEILK